MLSTRFAAGLLLCVSSIASAQTLSAPPSFRLVTPNGPGSITISTAGGWVTKQFALYDKGTRAVFFLENVSLGLDLSYILSNDETFDYNKETCLADVLTPLVNNLLAKATVKNKVSKNRTLPSGQTLEIGSYLIEKNEGIKFNQQNVFGFASHNHTCAEIHLSRTPFKAGEEPLFDPVLDAFTFDLNYAPVAADYDLMAKLLPPGMAAAYHSTTTPSPGTGTTSVEPSQSLTFALAAHPGYLHMDAPNYEITELSAKPNGKEFGIRAKDKKITGAEMLGFLFIPVPSQPTAIACREWMLDSEKNDGVRDRKIITRTESKSDSGVAIASVEYEQTKAPAASRFVRRSFIAQGDLCADISITAANALMAEASKVLLETLTFDPTRQPDFFAKFRFATVLFDHHQVAAAAPIFESALALVGTTDDPTKWRRVVTDQASMSYGIEGELTKSRALNQAAIAKDPDYPLYYYNLACADAELGDAAAAKQHLQQAFDRRANTIKGETLPDPTTDDSILKLKKDKAFWSFVEGLQKS
jgi:hypothetical protein